ncbi:MAG: 4Fe-4S binding protein [Candidatus Bathyarchaeota archaeon]|jgi:NAD-dependent dihydropyrimidine dehydrogenase PreA subunit|nr:4Fe-4S binding protein [Candidatus Bathyarchaeota archaeon]
MSVEIDRDKCDGCGVCVEMCPMDALRLDEGEKAYVKYDECWYCGCCELECPRKAVKLRLPYLIS